MTFWQIIKGIVINPKTTISSLQPKGGEIWAIVIATMIVRGILSAFSIPFIFDDLEFAPLIFGMNGAMGVLLYWVGAALYLHVFMRLNNKNGNIGDLLALLAYALIPYFLASGLSLAVYSSSPYLFPQLSLVQLTFIEITLTEGGLLWGVRGIAAYFSLQRSHDASRYRALLALVIANIIIIFFNVYSFITSSPYSY